MGTVYVLGQKEIADQAVVKAELSHEVTLGTIKEFVQDVQEELGGKAVMTDVRLKILLNAQSNLQKVAQATQDPRASLIAVAIQERLGDVARALGNFAGASQHYQRASDLAATLRQANPQNSQVRLAASTALLGLGDAGRRNGKLSEARQQLQQALELARALLAEEPENKDRARHVARVLTSLADALIDSVDYQAAHAAAVEARDLTQRWTTVHPDDPRLLLDHATAVRLLGEIALHRNDPQAARTACTEALAVAEKVFQYYPGHSDTVRMKANALERLGDACLAGGDLAGADNYYPQALALRKQLLKDDPLRGANKHMSALALARLGDLRGDQGESAAALDCFQNALHDFTEYLTEAPANVRVRADLARTHGRVGLLHRRIGQLDKARESLCQELDQRKELCQRTGQSAQQFSNLVLCLNQLALLEMEQLDFTAARQWLTQADELLENLNRDGLVRNRQAHDAQVRLQGEHRAFCEAVPQALANLEFALAQPGERGPRLLLYRGRILLRDGKYTEAAATADELIRRAPKDANLLLDAALIHAQCAARVETGQATALATLQLAARAGMPDVAKLVGHPDLEPLRGEEAYGKLVAEVKERVRKPK